MTDYKATPEQWAYAEQCALNNDAFLACILEIRARVETLEAMAHKHIVETSANMRALFARVEDLETAKRPTSKVYEINDPLQLTPEQAQQITDMLTPNSKPTPNPNQIRSSNHIGDTNKMVNSSAGLTSSNHLEKPDSSLVKRVALAISGIEYGLERDEEAVHWSSEARAAIREVMMWFDANCQHHAADELKHELER